MSEVELDLVPTDELVEVLKKRHDAVILTTVRALGHGRPDEMRVHWRGAPIVCLGALDWAKNHILDKNFHSE